MSDLSELSARLGRIDGRSYPAYKSIAGSYRFPGFQLLIDHVQGDPFAAPSRVRLVTSPAELGLPSRALTSPDRRRATADWLLRRLSAACREVRSRRGSGRSGLVAVDEPGQEVLTRTAVVVSEAAVEARLVVGLPAAGRRILALRDRRGWGSRLADREMP